MDRRDYSRTLAAKRHRICVFARRCVAASAPLSVLAAAVAIAASGGASSGPSLSAASSSGPITILNSRDGAAILSTGSMKPGGFVQGDVKITNAGTAATVRLTKSHLVDQVGVYGGTLSSRLQLTIVDLAKPASAVYSGPLSSLPNVALGSFAKGEARTYRFTAALPNGGPPASSTTGDNLYQGASASVEFDWSATGPGTPPPPKPVLTFTAANKQTFGTGVTVHASCTLACKTTISGFVSIAGARRTYKLPTGVISMPAHITTTATLLYSKAAPKAIAKALSKDKKVTANVSASLPGGTPHRLTITIKQH